MERRFMPITRFKTESRSIDGRPARPALVITCSCGETSSSFRGASAAEVDFRRQGWWIGARPKQDRCPSCNAKGAKPDTIKSFADLRIVATTPEPEQMPRPTSEAEKPADPTREERRIIFAKLQDVYLDEQRGYDNGWTDHRVATDLAVPRAWVAAIREENFGPTRDNAELREFMVQHAKIEKEIADLLRIADGALAAAQALSVRMKELERLAKAVRGQVAA